MVNDLNQSLYVDDEINLKEIFTILIESKKLIISTILFFTIASIIYSLSLKPSFLTSTILEIGYYETPDGNEILIEEPSDLISDLKVLIMKNSDNKFNQNVSMNSFEGKLLNLETTSSSVEQNEKILKEIINYIDERHSSLAILITDQKKNQISNEIEIIESQLSFYKSQNLLDLAIIESEILALNEEMRIDFENTISKLKNELPILDQEINQLEQVVIAESSNLNLLKDTNLYIERVANSPTFEQIISNYKSQINQLKRERIRNISDINALSEKLDALKKNTLQFDSLVKLNKKKKELENAALQSHELFEQKQKQKTLKNQLQLLMSQIQIKTLPINNIKTKTIKPKTQFTILLGLIIGFIAGIFLAFIRNFVKSYKESEA